MKERLITSFVGIILFFTVLCSPPIVLSAAVLIITCMAIYEINHAVSSGNFLTVVGVLISGLVYFGVVFNKLTAALFVCITVYLLLSVLLFGKIKTERLYMLGFANIAISASLSMLTVIRMQYSAWYVFLPFLFAWITDSGAYFTGKMIGKHKLVPSLSPKKTIEGAAGGSVSCIIISILYMFVASKCMGHMSYVGLLNSNNYLLMIVLSAIASVISQLGDLALSSIKREFNIKDYGYILPGHGGILDRFDSLIFVVPFVYFMLTHLIF